MTVKIKPVLFRVMRPFAAGLLVLGCVQGLVQNGSDPAGQASRGEITLRIPAA